MIRVNSYSEYFKSLKKFRFLDLSSLHFRQSKNSRQFNVLKSKPLSHCAACFEYEGCFCCWRRCGYVISLNCHPIELSSETFDLLISGFEGGFEEEFSFFKGLIQKSNVHWMMNQCRLDRIVDEISLNIKVQQCPKIPKHHPSYFTKISPFPTRIFRVLIKNPSLFSILFGFRLLEILVILQRVNYLFAYYLWNKGLGLSLSFDHHLTILCIASYYQSLAYLLKG